MNWVVVLSLLLPFALIDSVTAEESLVEIASQSLSSCAFGCFATGLQSSKCSPDDPVCICTDEVLLDTAMQCIGANCTIEEALAAENFTYSACQAPVRDRTHEVSYTQYGGMAISLAIVGLRLLQRLPYFGGVFGMDDVFIIAASAAMIPLSVLLILLADEGLGKDIWTIPFPQLIEILHKYYFAEILYVACLSLVKISILFFYLRIFREKRFRLLTYILMGIITAYFIAFDLALILQCNPIDLAWKTFDGEHCVNAKALGYAAGGVNIAIDLATIILPLPQVAKIQLSLDKKIPLIIVFSLGFFVTIISCLRIKYISDFADSDNITWDYVPIGYWSSLEVHISIIIACSPALRAIVMTIFSLPGYVTKSRFGSTVKSKFTGADKSGSQFSVLREENSVFRDENPMLREENAIFRDENLIQMETRVSLKTENRDEVLFDGNPYDRQYFNARKPNVRFGVRELR